MGRLLSFKYRSVCIYLVILFLRSIPVFSQTITSFSPVSGPTGLQGSTTITINGTGFSTTPANNLVFFGAVSVVPSVATATTLTVNVPTGTTYQYLSVLNKETEKRATAYSQEPFIPTFYNEGAMQFSTSADYTLPYSSSKPYFKVGDIDGDGKPDVVLLNVAANTVTVLRNTSSVGSLSFATGVDITTGVTPTCIAIEDMDGDGKYDLVVGNSGDKTFSVILNTSTPGTISFAAKADFSTPVPSIVDELATGDMDGDGKMDVFYIKFILSTTTVLGFLNNSTIGSASFTSDLVLNSHSSKNIFFADYDQDGKVDLSWVNSGNGLADLYRNTSTPGNISVQTKVGVAAGTGPFWFTAGDLDGDGKPDLVSTNTGGNNIATLRNISTSGTINFAARSGTPLGTTTPSCVVMTDIDGDGKPDIAVTAKGNNTVNIFRNNSTSGTISLGGRVSLSTDTSPNFLSFCDFDGDGKPDMAIANASSFTITKSLTKTKMFFSRMPF